MESELISQIARGCISVHTDADGKTTFERFTEKQIKDGYSWDQKFNMRAHAPAGMLLDFISDTAFVKFKVDIVYNCSRRFMSFDLYRDGVMIDFCKFVHPRKLSGLQIELFDADYDGKEHNFTVYFPGLQNMTMFDFTLSDNAVCKPAPEKKLKYLALGDSITQGYDVRYASLAYPSQIARALDAELFNFGIGGYFFDERSLDEAHPFKPDILTSAYGTNDWAKKASFEDFMLCADRYMARLKAVYPDTLAFGILPLWRGEKYTAVKPTGDFMDCREALRELYTKHGFSIIDGYYACPHCPEFYEDERLHPNDQGMTMISACYINEIRKALNK